MNPRMYMTLAALPLMQEVDRQRMVEAAENIRVELRAVTPEWAKDVLEHLHPKNRKLTSAWKKIETAILRGGWHVNGECIVFDRRGHLINGQHRLTAIIQSGRPLGSIIIYGVDQEAFETFDQGKRRTAADVLSVEKVENSRTLSTALNWQRRYELNTIEDSRSESIANDLVRPMLAKHPLMTASAAFADREGRSKFVPPGLTAFLHYQFTKLDPQAATAFFERICNGVGVERNSWEFLLRRRLEGMQENRDQTSQIEICALCIKVWSRIRTNEPAPFGDSRSYLKWVAKTEPFPTIR